MAEGLLIKQEKYLEAGIHIGTKLRVIDMSRFIYRTRNDGLFVLDLRKIDERIRLAGKMISHYKPEEIIVVASRAYSSMAAQRFGQITGAQVVTGRFVPGIFTNVSRTDFKEPKLAIICDPKGERQAVVECGKIGIPTIGLCDTDNYTMFIDWVIPCNNKGRRSLALIFWLLAREMAMSAGKIASYDDFSPNLEEFEAQATTPPSEEQTQQATSADEGDETDTEEDSKEEESDEKKEEEDGEKKEAPAAKPKAKKKASAHKGEKKPKAKKEEEEPAKEAGGDEEKAKDKEHAKGDEEAKDQPSAPKAEETKKSDKE